MSFIYDLADSWNSAGTTFTAIKMNVTNTASAAGSKIMDLQIGGTSQFVVSKSGSVGVGTASPNIANVSNAVTVNTINGTTGAIYEIGINGTNYAYLFANVSNTVLSSVQNTPLLFNTNNTERMRLDTSGNLGLGTSSPAVSLHVLTASGEIRAQNTTSGAGLISFRNANSSVTPLPSIGTVSGNDLQFVAGGATRATLDASGNVGIGTSTISPYSAANRALIVDGGANVASIQLNNSTTGSGLNSGGLLLLQTGNDSYIWNPKNSFLSIGTNNTERMRIDSAGNLGLGVTPSAWGSNYKTIQASRSNLYGAAAYGWYGVLFNAYSDNTNFIYQTTNRAGEYRFDVGTGAHAWFNAPSGTAGNNVTFTQAMTLDASGRLGIGTTTMTRLLTVGNGAGAKYATINGGNTNAGDGGALLFEPGGTFQHAVGNFSAILGSTYSDTFVIYNKANSPMLFYTNDAERMRITATGSALIGTTSVVDAERLNVTCAALGNGIRIEHTATSGYVGMLINRQGSDGKSAVFARAGTEVGSISVTSSATAYNTSSDYRLKDIDGPIVNSGAYIDALKPVQGSWKADGSRFIGLLAHEVQEVSETKIATGEKDGEEMQAMDYSAPEIIANIIAEVQSLRARVAEIERN